MDCARVLQRRSAAVCKWQLHSCHCPERRAVSSERGRRGGGAPATWTSSSNGALRRPVLALSVVFARAPQSASDTLTTFTCTNLPVERERCRRDARNDDRVTARVAVPRHVVVGRDRLERDRRAGSGRQRARVVQRIKPANRCRRTGSHSAGRRASSRRRRRFRRMPTWRHMPSGIRRSSRDRVQDPRKRPHIRCRRRHRRRACTPARPRAHGDPTRTQSKTSGSKTEK
ncbi:MAG: hypothetical protein JWP87_5287 [Labilithrix sp.]|nr:hypothetical protein [Labilithrix sp.]